MKITFPATPETASYANPSPPLVAEYTRPLVATDAQPKESTSTSAATSGTIKWSVDTTDQDLKDLLHTFQTYQEQGSSAFTQHKEFVRELFGD